MSVVFDFNASVSDAAPMYPMLLSVYLTKMKKKSGLFMDVICVLFSCVFTSQIKFCECCVQFQCFTH